MLTRYNNKIRIAFFAEMLIEDFDGASRTMFQLLKRIDKSRFDFLFFCGLGPDELFGFPCIKIPTVSLPINNKYTMAMPFLVKEKLQQSLHDFSPQVVHIATPSLMGQYAVKYAGINHLPVISIYHTHFISYIDYYLKHAPFLINTVKAKVATTQRIFYNQCDKIYVPSESIAEELRQGGIDDYRMKIWKRGIDTRLFSPHKRSPSWMQSLTGNQRPNVLFASRVVWEKNIETLFRIYDLAKQQNHSYNFIIAGDGQALKACKKYMKDAIFTGHLDHQDLARLYASSDVFLFPSVSETYGNVIVEAMASGLPCIIADGGGSKDTIQHGINGYKCSPFDEEDYVEKISLLLNDPLLARRISKEGLYYSQKLSWNFLANEYFEDVSNLAENSLAEIFQHN